MNWTDDERPVGGGDQRSALEGRLQCRGVRHLDFPVYLCGILLDEWLCPFRMSAANGSAPDGLALCQLAAVAGGRPRRGRTRRRGRRRRSSGGGSGRRRCRRRGTGRSYVRREFDGMTRRSRSVAVGHRATRRRRRVHWRRAPRPRARSSTCWPTRARGHAPARRHRGHRLRRGSRRRARVERPPPPTFHPIASPGRRISSSRTRRSACGSSRSCPSLGIEGGKADGASGPWPSSTCCRGRLPARRSHRSRTRCRLRSRLCPSAPRFEGAGDNPPPGAFLLRTPGGEPLVEAVVAPADLQRTRADWRRTVDGLGHRHSWPDPAPPDRPAARCSEPSAATATGSSA